MNNVHTEAVPEFRLDLTTMQDLLKHHNNSPEPTWIVEGILRTDRGRPSLLCGYPHVGKSTLARQLAIQVSKGGAFLGRTTTKSRVLYWYSEDSPLDAANDFQRQGATADSSISVMRPTATDTSGRLAEIATAIRTSVEQGQPFGLVIVETICDLLQLQNENDNAEVAGLMTQFIETVVKPSHGAAFLMLHQFNKSSDAAVLNNNLLRVSGARAFTSKSDAKLLIYQMSDLELQRIFATKVRTGQEIVPTYLKFDSEDGTSRLGERVADVVVAAKESEKLKREMQLDANILSHVEDSPGIGKSMIRVLVGGKTTVVHSAIERLVEQGHLKTMKLGKTIHVFTAQHAENGQMTAEACEGWPCLGEEE